MNDEEKKSFREDILSIAIQTTSLRLILQDRGLITRDEYLRVCMMFVDVLQRATPALDWGRILEKIEGDQDIPKS